MRNFFVKYLRYLQKAQREKHTATKRGSIAPLLEGDLSSDGDLGAVALDGDLVGELTDLAVDLDLAVEEGFLRRRGE